MAFDELIASITLAGSLLSFIATSLVLISFAVYHKEQRSFRHALVFNLALSEFINSLNNSISGIFYVRDHQLQPGAVCVLNGMIGQLSVQAADFSILAIALVTLLTITRRTFMPTASRTRKILICLSVWIVPLTTTIIAAATNSLVPLNGNWCWISGERTDLRYGLTHGWRFAVIFATIAIYIYVAWYMAWYFKSLENIDTESTTSTSFSKWKKKKMKGFEEIKEGGGQKDMELGVIAPRAQGNGTQVEYGLASRSQVVNDEEMGRMPDWLSADSANRNTLRPISWPRPVQPVTADSDKSQSSIPARFSTCNKRQTQADPTITAMSEFPVRRQTRQVEREIKRMLLLNGYPVTYVLLWIPGIVSRLLEASGQPSSSQVLATLQSSSQFIGFANAITYGFNRQVRKRVKEELDGFRSRWNARRRKT